MEFEKICIDAAKTLGDVLYMPLDALYNPFGSNTVLALIAVGALFLLIQLLLCFAVKNIWIKLIPVYYCAGWIIYYFLMDVGGGADFGTYFTFAFTVPIFFGVILAWILRDIILFIKARGWEKRDASEGGDETNDIVPNDTPVFRKVDVVRVILLAVLIAALMVMASR